MSNGRGSVMVHNFSVAPQARIPRSAFNRSHGYKTTFNAGYLIPVLVDEALPGDTINCNMTSFCRMSTPIVPIMDNMFLESFFFAVPYRLVWTNWEKFNGAQDNPGDSISFTIPTTTAPGGGVGYGEMSLQDYMGLPTKIASLVHNNLHPRAYNLVWNQWFRSEDLQNSVTVDTGNGPDTSTNYALLQRGKRHDYFTSCLPWPQKGTAVSIPLGTSAPVKGIGIDDSYNAYASNVGGLNEYGGTTGASTFAFGASTSLANKVYVATTSAGAHASPLVYADLSSATAATINSLRQSFQIQKLLERDARGGTRYTEILRSHFGVISPDARLQRAEFLGGGRSPVNINPVAQTSGTSASGTTTPLGNLAAFATCIGRGHGFVKSFTEHCLILGLVNVRADLNYQQGLNRLWSRQTRYDYYWPAFAHIGEQAVLNKEIYCDASGNDAGTFGYQERYSEYRYKPSLITGQFRSNSSTPLDYWHLAQKFSSLPSLGSSFIVDAPPMSRILAAGSTGPHFFFDAYFKYVHVRPMPTYSVPGLIDHF